MEALISGPSDLSRRQLFLAGGGLAAFAGLPGLPGLAEAVDSTEPAVGEALLAEFGAVLRQTHRAAKLAFAQSTARRQLDQATGLLHLLNNLSLDLAFHIHDNDPQHPELFRYMGPDRKQGGDNQDALYLGFAVDAAHTYRLYGNRGTAKHISITTVERGATPWGGAMGAALFGLDLKASENGDFEVILSAAPHAGNWIKLSQRDFRVTIRQFFADWENERPMRLRVELMGEMPPPPVATAEQIMSCLRETGEWIENTISFWQTTIDMFRPTPNQFVSWRKLTGDKMGRRWIFADTLPEIECQLVPHEALFNHLPKGVKRMRPSERREQIAARRRGIYNRFNWM